MWLLLVAVPFPTDGIYCDYIHIPSPLQVTIQVENIDKRGSFIGTLFYEGSKNLAQSLIEEGLAYLHSSAYGALYDVLYPAEREAKKRRLKIWESYDESQVEDER